MLYFKLLLFNTGLRSKQLESLQIDKISFNERMYMYMNRQCSSQKSAIIYISACFWRLWNLNEKLAVKEKLRGTAVRLHLRALAQRP